MEETKNLPIAPLPDNWQEILAKAAKEQATVEAPKSAYISTKGGIMVWQGQQVPDNKLTCVILDSVIERTYYDTPYDDGFEPPVCFSLVRNEDGMVPHPNSQAMQHKTCAGCPQAEWGSDPVRGKAQACKSRRRLALIAGDCVDKGVEAIMSAPIVGLRVSPTSTRQWGTYVQQLSAVIKRPPFGVITKITLKPHSQFQMSFDFAFTGIIGEAELAAVMARRTEVGDSFLTPYEKVDPEAAAAKAEAEAAEKAARANKGGKRKY